MAHKDEAFSGLPLLAPADSHWTESVVCEGHTTYCKNHGHATETVGNCCARCGEPVSRETMDEAWNETFPPCDNCGQWEEFCMCMEITRCPVCGDLIDWCTGHGDIGDPRGSAILAQHDDDDHSRCHWSADCAPRNYWGTLKTDVSDDHCPLCERENPHHYTFCPKHRS